ncbi:MAG: ATP-binding cassette domain-containing protein, partial [Gammaproteobacteria bacterium]
MSIEAHFARRLGDFALDAQLELPASGVTALFGPSGSGKTTILRAMAGLDRIRGGRLTVNGETWQGRLRFLPAHRRAVGYVFQEPSLFPHLDVRGNLEYGARRTSPEQLARRVGEAAAMLDLQSLLSR